MLETALLDSVAVVSRYNIPGNLQTKLVEFFQRQLQDWIRHRPGFVAGSILGSIDQRYVIICTNWKRAEDGINFMECDHGKKFSAELAVSGAKERESHVYNVDLVVSMPNQN